MLISDLWNAGVARRRGRGGNTAVGVQEKGGRRWREVCVFPGTRASKPAWPVANRWQARSPVGHKQLGDALFPPRAKFRESHSGLGDPASLWPPGPPLGTRRRSATRCAVRCGPTHGLAFGFLQGRRAWKPALPQLARRQPFLAPPPRGCDWQADRGQGTEDRGQGIGMHHSKFTIQNLAARSPLLTGVPGKNRTTARRSFLTASPDPWEPAPRPKSNPEKSHEHR